MTLATHLNKKGTNPPTTVASSWLVVDTWRETRKRKADNCLSLEATHKEFRKTSV